MTEQTTVPEPTLLHEMNPPNPWMPEQDRARLAALGKLAEECAECAAAALRCIIQGIDEKEPVTGVVNAEWLTKEIADVMSSATVAVNVLGLNPTFIMQRQTRKVAHLRAWHDLIRANAKP